MCLKKISFIIDVNEISWEVLYTCLRIVRQEKSLDGGETKGFLKSSMIQLSRLIGDI